MTGAIGTFGTLLALGSSVALLWYGAQSARRGPTATPQVRWSVVGLVSGAVIAFAALVALRVDAAPPVRTMYRDALAQEEAVRAALVDRATPETVLTSVRTVVGSFEAVVRHYPASDIPAQARRLYTVNWTRLIADVLRPERTIGLDRSSPFLARARSDGHAGEAATACRTATASSSGGSPSTRW